MRLSDYLKAEGMTLAQFGSQIGISASTVHRYATGLRVPKPEVMSRVFAATDGRVTPNDFFDLPTPASQDAA